MSNGLVNLQEEYKEIKKSDKLCSIAGSAGPIITNKKRDYFHWKACFNGPKNTPYMYGLFILEMKFPSNYPDEGPDVQMRTPTFHPNINNSDGHICVDYLKNWKKEYNIIGIINTVHDLLFEPNPNDPYGFYKGLDEKTRTDKATKMRMKYAGESQSYDWNNSWNKGWSNDI